MISVLKVKMPDNLLIALPAEITFLSLRGVN